MINRRLENRVAYLGKGLYECCRQPSVLVDLAVPRGPLKVLFRETLMIKESGMRLLVIGIVARGVTMTMRGAHRCGQRVDASV